MNKIVEYRNNNMGKGKAIFSKIILVSVFFLAAALISCNGGLSEKSDVKESDSIISEYVQIGFKLSVPEFEDRKAIPNSSSYSNMVYVLTGLSEGDQEETLGTWGSLTQLQNASLTIHTGQWRLTLTSYQNTSSNYDYYDYEYGYSSSSIGYDSAKPILQDTIELILTQSSTLAFTLKEVENCKVNGSFEYTINYSESRSENWSLSAKLLNVDDLSQTEYSISYSTSSSYTRFTCSNLPSGNYLLQIQFIYKNGDTSFESYTMPLIQIAAGLKTTGSKTLSAGELTRFYSINYSYLENGVMPENSVSTYTPYKAVVLENPTRTNYKFLGWYYSTDWTDENKLPVNSQGKYILNQNHDQSGDVYIYARWQRNGYEQDGFEWHLSDEGVLTISGEGVVPFYSYSFPEWENATSLVVEEGITGFYYSENYAVGFSNYEYYSSRNYTQNITSVSLPSTLTSITAYCFYGCSSLQTINIPENVESIGNYAFKGCSSLTSPLTLPQALRSIGEEAFSGCTRISSITIPSDLLTLYRSAFRGWTNSQTITLDWNSNDETERTINESYNNYTDGPNAHYKDGVAAWFSWSLSSAGVLTIRGNGVIPFYSYDYSEWEDATSVVVEEGVTGFCYSNSYAVGFSNYNYYSYTGYTQNITSVTLPSTITSIPTNCFYGCSSLESITIPEDVTTIGENVFNGCSSLRTITIEGNITSISGGAFYGRESLESITLPEGLTSIGESAFYGCKSLTSIPIPSTLTSIGNYAFAYCTGVSSITVPATVTSQFNKNVFQGWRSNQTIILDWNSTDSSHAMPYIETGYYGHAASGEYGYAASYNGTHAKYRNNVYAWNGCALNADGTAIIVSGDGQHYPYNPEIDLTNVTSIIVSEGITSLVSCWNISEYNQTVKTITLPSTLTGIGEYTFKGYEGLEEINIPASVTGIGGQAFRDCSSLESILIPNGITNIYEYTFAGCSSLESIAIPVSVTSIEQSAFKDCTSLESVNFNSVSLAIPEECFAGCTSLSTVIGTAAITSIGKNAFRGCAALSSISLPATLTSIDEYAFYKCTGFTALTIPSSVIEIGSSAFDYCTNTQLITLDWNAGDTTSRNIAGDAFGYTGIVVKYKDGTTYGN